VSTAPFAVGGYDDQPRAARAPARARSPIETVAVVAFAALLAYVVIFWRLGVPTFWDPDEAHYAETTREMIATGDWLAPHYNGDPFFDKPALFHQLQGLAMVVAGTNEFGARIVPALSALALVGVTVWLGVALDRRRVGAVGGLILTVSPGVFALARYAILDTLFTACMFGGASLLAVAALRNRPRLQWPGYVCLALGFLTKGPLALALTGLAFLLACAVSVEVRRRLLGLRLFAGCVIVLALALPWFVYMYLRFDGPFVDGYLLDENVRLFASSRFGNQPAPWFYFQILAAGLLPWTGVVVGRLVDDIRSVVRGERLDAFEVLLWVWSGGVVGFFTASSFKLDHYVFPAAPALALLCARGWLDASAPSAATRHAGARAGAYLVGPLLVAMGVGIGYFLIARLDLPRGAIVVPILMTAFGVLTTVRMNLAGRLGRALPRMPWTALLGMAVAYAGVILFVLPVLEERKVMPDLAQYVSSHAPADAKIATYRMNRWTPALRFYLGRDTEFLEDPATAARFFAENKPFYCVMSRRAAEEFAGEGVPLRVLYERDGLWATSGRSLWRRRIPPVQFVVVTAAQ
jgi:4-amino-4-deoxy-L-arabinose transferase-like glycosyltransferase